MHDWWDALAISALFPPRLLPCRRHQPRRAALIAATSIFFMSIIASNARFAGDLEREGFVMFERGSAVEADKRDAGNCEFDRQHVALQQ
jgi:hypothetical protein